MSKWTKKTLKIKGPVPFKTRPGNNAFVANRGEVYFEIPNTWIIKPSPEGTIAFYDKEPPDDNCCMEMSTRNLNMELNWDGLPLGQMLLQTAQMDRGEAFRPEVHEIQRGQLQIAWLEDHFIPKNEPRPAISRWMIAKSFDVLPFFTFNFWKDDYEMADRFWTNVVETLRLAEGLGAGTRN
jgi:hypothetical protein